MVLTHGDGEPLAASLTAFYRHVTPEPTEVRIVHDGPVRMRRMEDALRAAPRAEVETIPRSGFCGATAYMWERAAEMWERGTGLAVDYVFWLEHDFEVTRDVDLTDLSEVLDRQPMIAQMSLMRDAVNADEIEAGGLYELRRDEFVPRDSWLDHASYMTTNPSLMRRQFMADNPWPEYPEECEGLFSIDLAARGYRFGVWGDGSPWCRHTGKRTGFGY